MLSPLGSVSEGRSAPTPGARYRVGAIDIDLDAERVSREGRELRLERSGAAVLRCLLERPGEIVSKDDLLRVGWPGRVVSENSLAKAISKLRFALGDEEGRLLRVVHG